MMETPYKTFELRAVEAGVSAELAHSMYNIDRDAHEHCWMPPLKEWVDDEESMIARALAEPEMMREACDLLFYTDGLTYDEGQRNAGIDDEKRREIERWIFKR